MTFDTLDAMLNWLAQYRPMYYHYIALDARLTGIRSPSFEESPSGHDGRPLDARIIDMIQDKEELEDKMEEIRLTIAMVKDIRYLSYSILWEKFVMFKTLEEIALMHHYSVDHVKHELYPRAKLDLFRLVQTPHQTTPEQML